LSLHGISDFSSFFDFFSLFFHFFVIECIVEILFCIGGHK
jgi:hypothetical protein